MGVLEAASVVVRVVVAFEDAEPVPETGGEKLMEALLREDFEVFPLGVSGDADTRALTLTTSVIVLVPVAASEVE